ncbi:MAG: hypothetical protein LBH40_00720 [Alphaproteobacteria bacterium]|jgi:hypothetical protein|nr:hypothetical protein [Alphaproteobacteria bacterium]
MKYCLRLLLILGTVLLSLNAYSFDQVVSISGGISNTQRDQTHNQVNTSYLPGVSYQDCKIDNLRLKAYTTSSSCYYSKSNNTSAIGYNFDLEHQLRWNLISVGTGLNVNQTNVSIDGYEPAKYTTYIPYLSGSLKVYEIKSFALRVGATVGVDYTIVKEECKDSYFRFHNSIFIDGEYAISSKFITFSRAGFSVVGDKPIKCDTTTLIKEPDVNLGYNVAENYTESYLRQQFKVNFGIRYKI